jgi:hypothetical protein
VSRVIKMLDEKTGEPRFSYYVRSDNMAKRMCAPPRPAPRISHAACVLPQRALCNGMPQLRVWPLPSRTGRLGSARPGPC